MQLSDIVQQIVFLKKNVVANHRKHLFVMFLRLQILTNN